MVERLPTATEWMMRHPAEYATLFDDGALDAEAVEAHADAGFEEQVALSALARHVKGRVSISKNWSGLLQRGVDRVLYASYEQELGAEHAFFTELTLDELYALRVHTTRSLQTWERACGYHRVTSPFSPFYTEREDIPLDDTGRPPIKLTLMAAAGLLNARAGNPLIVPKASTPHWAKVVTLYGPGYLHNLFSIEESATAQGPYSIQSLTQQLGWPEGRVRAICTPSIRLRWSSNLHDPKATIARVKQLHDEILSSEALAQKLAITEKQAANLLTPAVLAKYAYIAPFEDPIPKFSRMLADLRSLTNEFALSYGVAKWLIVNAPKVARKRARIVTEELQHIPKGVAPESWANATARHPYDMSKRMQYVEKSKQYWAAWRAIVNPLPLYRKDGRVFEVSDTSNSPEVVLFESGGDERTRELVELLIEACEFEQKQTNLLLDFFTEDQSSIPEEIDQLLREMRQVAKANGLL